MFRLPQIGKLKGQRSHSVTPYTLPPVETIHFLVVGGGGGGAGGGGGGGGMRSSWNADGSVTGGGGTIQPQ